MDLDEVRGDGSQGRLKGPGALRLVIQGGPLFREKVVSKISHDILQCFRVCLRCI
ncbi:hypothetical protein M569_17457 [Genlisea aurea]|uniref:Uncharacterized protein n=1 Tax=Genlisea aurea TaxID=192259 RepID=S8BZ07_9LAMI|nr:hypothetical protein M569_17457 [Genlisea aurea]